MTTRALDDYGFIAAMYELDLTTEHAHPLKCSTLRDHLVLFHISKGDRCGGGGEIFQVSDPAGRDGDKDGLEAWVCHEGAHEVCCIICDFRLLISIRDLAELGPGSAVCGD